MQNIDIVFNGKANFSSAASQLDMLRQKYAQLATTIRQSNVAAAQSGDQATIEANSQRLKDLRTNMNRVSSASQAFYTDQIRLTAASTKFNDALEKNKVKFTDIARNMGVVKAAYKEQLALQNMMVTGWSKDASGRISADIMIPRDVLTRADNFSSRLGYMNTMLRSGSESMINWGKNTQWAGRQLMVGFTVPTTMALAAMTKFGYEMDKQLTSITKVYGDAADASRESNQQIRDDAMKTAATAASAYGQSFKDTLEIQQQLAAAGGPNSTGAALQKATLEVTRAKILGELDLQDAMKTTITLQNAYNMSGKDLTNTFNFMNSIENQTVLSMQDMTEGLPRVSGIMNSLGVSVQQTAVFLTAFKAAGIDAAEGANALKSIAFKAIAPTPTADKAFQNITGIPLGDIVAKTKGELLPTLQEISKVMEGVDRQKQVDIIARVFGIQQGSKAFALIDQLKSLTDETTQVGKAWDVANQSASDWAQTAQGEMDTLYNSTSNRMQRALAELQNSFANLGQTVLPLITDILNKVSGMISSFSNMDEGTKRAILLGAGITAIIGPVVMLAGLFGNFLGTLMKGTSLLLGLFTRFKVLNAETRAGELITKAATAAMTDEQLAMKGLTNALVAMNAELATTNTLQAAVAKQQGVAASTVPTNFNVPQGFPSNPNQLGQNMNNVNAQSADTAKNWEKTKGAVLGTTAALGALAAVGGGDSLIGKIGNYALIGSAVLGIGSSLKGIIPSMDSVKNRWTAIGQSATVMRARSIAGMTGVTLGLNKLKGAMGSMASFAAGPWGLAIMAAGAGILTVIQQANEAAAENKRIFDDAATSVEGWRAALGYTPKDSKASSNPASADMTVQFTQQIDELKKNDQDTYDAFVKLREEGASLKDKLGKAIEQGAKVIQDGGSQDDAIKAVQIALTAMGEGMSQQEFDIKIKPQLVFDTGYQQALNAKRDIDNMLKDAMTKGGKDTTGFGEDVTRLFVNGDQLTTQEGADLRGKVANFWNTYRTLNKAEQAGAARDLKETFMKPLQDQYAQFVEMQKRIGATPPSFEDWLNNEGKVGKAADAMKNLIDVTNKSNGKAEGAAGYIKDYADMMKYLDGQMSKTGDSTGAATKAVTAQEAAVQAAKDAWSDFDSRMEAYNITQKSVASAMKDVMTNVSNQGADIANNAWSDMVNSRLQGISDAFQSRADAIDAQAEAAKNRQDAADRAMKDTQKRAQDDLDKAQKQQTDQVTAMWDNRIKAIDDAVKAEQDADAARQKIFDAEKERVQRWHDLYEKQIDYQQAIAAGNLDTAARAQNDIMAMQQGYAITDAAANASDVSKAKQDALDKTKDQLQQQKDAALEALKEQQDAEKAALDARQQAEEDALKAKQDVENKRFDAQKDSLQKQEQAAKDSAQRQLNIEKMKLDSEMAVLQAYVPKNQAEMQAHLKAIEKMYAAHGVVVNLTGGQWAGILNDSILNGTKAAVVRMRSEVDWQDAGAEAAQQMIAGAFPGMDINAFVKYLTTGELPTAVVEKAIGPQAAKEYYSGNFSRKPADTPYHTGGIAGISGGGWAGKKGHPDEMPATLLRGEGILSQGAMRIPGMTDFVLDANAGKLPRNIGGPDLGLAAGTGLALGAIMKGMIATAIGQGILNTMMNSMAQPGVGATPGQAGVYGDISLSAEQLNNAASIVSTGRSMGASQRDLTVALMTAMQESSLRNLNYGDRDSLGLFQQRPSAGWGTPAQITNPTYAAQKFFSALMAIKGRDTMALWQEAQAVQRSAYPTAYAQWQNEAEAILASMNYATGNVPGIGAPPSGGGWIKPANGPRTSPYGMRVNPVTGVYRLHDGSDIGAPAGSAIYAAKTGTVANVSQYNPAWAGLYTIINHGGGIATGYAHQSAQMVRPGQMVQGGQQIGRVGSTGNSTGPHLHFQYFKDGKTLNPNLIIPGMLTGGTVELGGLAMLHPGEMVLPKPLTDNVTRGLAGGLGAQYTVTVDLRGAYIKEDVDVQRAVETAMHNVEYRKGPSRKVGG